MPENRGSIFDDFSRLMTDAAEMAHGARREAGSMFKSQIERLLASMDMVSREEFEAVRDMALAARDENDRLAKRVASLEARLTGREIPPSTGDEPALSP